MYDCGNGIVKDHGVPEDLGSNLSAPFLSTCVVNVTG